MGLNNFYRSDDEEGWRIYLSTKIKIINDIDKSTACLGQFLYRIVSPIASIHFEQVSKSPVI